MGRLHWRLKKQIYCLCKQIIFIKKIKAFQLLCKTQFQSKKETELLKWKFPNWIPWKTNQLQEKAPPQQSNQLRFQIKIGKNMCHSILLKTPIFPSRLNHLNWRWCSLAELTQMPTRWTSNTRSRPYRCAFPFDALKTPIPAFQILLQAFSVALANVTQRLKWTISAAILPPQLFSLNPISKKFSSTPSLPSPQFIFSQSCFSPLPILFPSLPILLLILRN